mmetsp:Transcript_95858/g.248198  ORF Transcript_95858/g.248198 Transcript_95858/m.248198 type:complete len:200 (+) Transcript_95858:277-876(+)
MAVEMRTITGTAMSHTPTLCPKGALAPPAITPYFGKHDEYHEHAQPRWQPVSSPSHSSWHLWAKPSEAAPDPLGTATGMELSSNPRPPGWRCGSCRELSLVDGRALLALFTRPPLVLFQAPNCVKACPPGPREGSDRTTARDNPHFERFGRPSLPREAPARPTAEAAEKASSHQAGTSAANMSMLLRVNRRVAPKYRDK